MVTTISDKPDIVSSGDALPESLHDLPEDTEEINIGSGLLWELSRESKPELEDVIGLDMSSGKVLTSEEKVTGLHISLEN